MSFAAAYYVFVVGILVPWICIRSYFKLKEGARFPPKPALRKQNVAMVIHAIYDVIAGYAYLRLYKQTEPEVNAAAHATVM
jgi:hypothetical protein